MSLDERKSTQEFVMRTILIKYCGQVLIPENVLKIIEELIYEIREGSCSWAFASKDA